MIYRVIILETVTVVAVCFSVIFMDWAMRMKNKKSRKQKGLPAAESKQYASVYTRLYVRLLTLRLAACEKLACAMGGLAIRYSCDVIAARKRLMESER